MNQGRLAVWGLGIACLLVLATIHASRSVPSGGDGGNMLYYGRLLAEGRFSEIHYPPVVPLLGFIVWQVSGHDYGAALFIIKLLPAQFLALLAYASTRWLSALGARRPDHAFAFVAANGLLWFELTWGGYAQMLSTAFAVLGISEYLRVPPERRPSAASVVWFAAALLTNPYPAFFAPVALAAYAVFAPPARFPPTRWKPAAVACLLLAALALAVYLSIQLALKGGDPLTETGAANVALRIPLTAWEIRDGLLAPVLAFAGVAIGVPPRSEWRPGPWIAAVLVPVAVASLIQWATLMNVTGRVLYLAGTVLSIGAAYGFSELPARSLSETTAPRVPGRPWARRGIPTATAPALLFIVVIASAGIAAAATVRDVAYFAPLGDDFKTAIGRLEGEPAGQVLVVAPEPGTIDAWWLRAGTLRDVFVYGTPWAQLRAEDFERTEFATAFMHGRAAVVRERAALVSSGCLGAGVSLESFTAYNAIRTFHAPDSNLTLESADHAPWSASQATWTSSIVDDHVIDEAPAPGGTLRRALDGRSGGLEFSVSHPHATALQVTFWAPPGARWARAEPILGGLDAAVFGAGLLGQPLGLRVDLRGSTPTPETIVDPSRHWIRFELRSETAGPIRFHAGLDVDLARGEPAAVDLLESARTRGITAVYARDPPAEVRARIERDPGTERIFSGAESDLTLYRLRRAGLDEPCRPTVP